MTTTTQLPVGQRPGRPAPAAADRLRLLAGPAALVAGPVLAVTGMSLHVKGLPEDLSLIRTVSAHPSLWLASHLLQSVGMALLAAGALAVWRLAHGRGATLTALGAAVTTAGAALMALGDIAHGAVAFALAGRVDDAASLAIQKGFFANPAVLTLFTGGTLLPLGVLLLGAGVLRSGAVPRWLGLVVLVSPIFVQLGFNTAVPLALAGLPFVVGMAGLARAAARAG